MQLDWGRSPLVMGIINITPDSFSDGGQFLAPEKAISHAGKLIREGAHILDLGAESSRPGSLPIDENTEIDRLIPVVEAINREFPHIPISVDTYKPKVIERALAHGAAIINNIKGFGFETEECLTKMKGYDPYLIIMHMRGNPLTMQENLDESENPIPIINSYFEKQISLLRDYGISHERIILDPGIGFGKTVEQNCQILKNLSSFKTISGIQYNFPLLIGLSRKSFMGHILEEENPKNRDLGSKILEVYSYQKGAAMIRTHDVLSLHNSLTLLKAVEDVS